MIGNRFEKQIPQEAVALPNGTAALPTAATNLRVTTWNLGYGGMGAESDFFFDGGTQRRPPTAVLVDKNVAGIKAAVRNMDDDVLLFQEAARPSWTNYGRDLVATLDAVAGDRKRRFDADILTRGVPKPFRVEIGNATYFRHRASSYDLIALPLEPYFEFGLFRKNYRIHVLRLDGQVPWVIANIHLSAFDPEEIDVRRQQLSAVFDFAEREFRTGRHVVIGGDWNYILSDAAFPHSTADEHSFWVRSFPGDMLPDGWAIAAGPKVPTVRLAHAPYQRGANRTIAVDGFIVSPNVAVLDVVARDLGFEWSDHNPVSATFQAR